MGKFFQGTYQKRLCRRRLFPESGKKRPQRPAQGELRPTKAQSKARRAAQPQIAAADAKGQNQQRPAQRQQEKAVGKAGVPGPEGPQKGIQKPQQCPQQTADAQLLQRLRRRRHPKSRCSQPPLGRASS